MARVLVLGGDGFCGWPTSLYLSDLGYDVTIVDNLTRRRIDAELGLDSLTPIASISERLQAWNSVRGKEIKYVDLTLGEDYDPLVALIREEKPEAIIHFAEQRAAPYSMMSPWHKRYTVRNNLCVTHDVLCALVEAKVDAHLVHLGSMGVYGYGTQGAEVPEGYIKVTTKDANSREIEQEILHPTDPGSIYHLTKSQDELFFYFYNKNDGVRVTDLHQGVVWGIQTSETEMDDRLSNRFDYDGNFGTVVNRFLVQAAIGQPLSVYGVGGQTRAFINIKDTCRGIALAIQNPPKRGDRVKIMNLVAQTQSVQKVAELVSEISGAPIQHVKNPRKEAPENRLEVAKKSFSDLGFQPQLLNKRELANVLQLAKRHANRCNTSKIPSEVTWT